MIDFKVTLTLTSTSILNNGMDQTCTLDMGPTAPYAPPLNVTRLHGTRLSRET